MEKKRKEAKMSAYTSHTYTYKYAKRGLCLIDEKIWKQQFHKSFTAMRDEISVCRIEEKLFVPHEVGSGNCGYNHGVAKIMRIQ